MSADYEKKLNQLFFFYDSSNDSGKNLNEIKDHRYTEFENPGGGSRRFKNFFLGDIP